MADSQPTSVDDVPVPDEAELNAPDPKETEAKPAQASEETTKETEATDEPEGESKPEEPAEPEAEEEPQDPKEIARRGYAERTKLRGQVTQALGQRPEYTPATAEQLVEQGIDPAMAEVEALRQEVARDRIINQMTELNSSLNADANNILRDFPVFDVSSKQYDEAFTKQVEALYKEASQYQLDPSGQFVVNASMPLYNFYSQMAEFRGSGVKQGAINGQKAAEKMLAAAETPGSSVSQGSKPEDPFLAGLTGKRTNN